ncbi:MAG: hypothetical protein HYV60_20515 [Planctomycetia bacterium]|nr:hypothetical protein [Planctomycetia bacterium]
MKPEKLDVDVRQKKLATYRLATMSLSTEELEILEKALETEASAEIPATEDVREELRREIKRIIRSRMTAIINVIR